MRCLITGGSGFIAAWIMRRMVAHDVQFRVLDTRTDSRLSEQLLGEAARTIEWVPGDISDPRAVTAAARDCELIVHLAAVLTPACQADPIRGAEINLLGSLNIFRAAIECDIPRVVYMSSAGVFGPNDGTYPMPTTHYGAFKLAV